ncbi:DMT family transporter [Rhodobacteraceae bacterium CCMM004]|nr:DMT family transporter [Rhodobacteraceae bacterium CCMM004]
MSPNARGAALMVGSMTAFTLNDACLKALGDTLPLMQTLLLRGLVVTVLMGAIAWRAGALRVDFARRDWGLIALRSLAEVAAAYFFLTALFNMPLASATAILQTLPLAVTLGAALVLREPVGWPRLAAIAVGFCGMLLIVRPGADDFTVYSIFALCAVVAVTVRDLATRRMSAGVPNLTVAVAGALAVTLFAAGSAADAVWVPLGPREWVLLGLSSVLILVAYLLSVMVMRVGEVGFVAPFRYSALVVALVVGFLVFGEWPATPTLIGAAIVVATGAFTLWRERRAALRRRNAASGK